MVHLLGFAGSAFIIVSITMRSVFRLRVIGLIGAITFTAYGAILGAWPVVVTNLVTTSIHVVHLRTLADERQHKDDDGQRVLLRVSGPTRPRATEQIHASSDGPL